jgi:hypothetical protein
MYYININNFETLSMYNLKLVDPLFLILKWFNFDNLGMLFFYEISIHWNLLSEFLDY